MDTTPKTLLDAAWYFHDEARCEAYMRELRWPGGSPICEHCGSERIGEVKTRRLLRCKDCRKMIYARLPIMVDSALPTSAWLLAIWCVANGGVTTAALARVLKINPKSSWRMMSLIRAAQEANMKAETWRPVRSVSRILKQKQTATSKQEGRGSMSPDPMAAESKPRGWSKFNALARKLAAVPKEAADKVIAQRRAKRKRKRRTK